MALTCQTTSRLRKLTLPSLVRLPSGQAPAKWLCLLPLGMQAWCLPFTEHDGSGTCAARRGPAVSGWDLPARHLCKQLWCCHPAAVHRRFTDLHRELLGDNVPAAGAHPETPAAMHPCLLLDSSMIHVMPNPHVPCAELIHLRTPPRLLPERGHQRGDVLSCHEPAARGTGHHHEHKHQQWVLDRPGAARRGSLCTAQPWCLVITTPPLHGGHA